MGRRHRHRTKPRTLGRALRLTVGSTLLPGSGHLALRKRSGFLFLIGFLLLIGAGIYLWLTSSTEQLLKYATSANVLLGVIIGLIVVGVLWIGVIVRTFVLARPRPMRVGAGIAGFTVVTALCLTVTLSLGILTHRVYLQHGVITSVFPSAGSGAGSISLNKDSETIAKPRINILLLGSDAGPDRTGVRTDTMMVASIDTATGKTVLFGLPRNLQHARFPQGSPMAKQFPNGFHDTRDPNSGEYLLNAVYKYGTEHPQLAPSGPSSFPGLNLLYSSIGHMLGVELDYYIQVNMAGFASLIDALGGIDVNVGPRPIPINGLGPHGEQIKPRGWIPAGQQHLNGEQALWYGRARSDGSDYMRMSRQRCLIKYVVEQKTPLDVLTNFQAVATATQNNVSTNIPQDMLPALLTLAGKVRTQPIHSISFDPNLQLPNGGRFSTATPDFDYMRQLVKETQNVTTSPSSAQPSSTSPTTTTPKKSGNTTSSAPPPASLDQICATDPSQSNGS